MKKKADATHQGRIEAYALFDIGFAAHGICRREFEEWKLIGEGVTVER